MKIRNSFVSNSSSCSFCIITKAKTKEDFVKTLKIDLNQVDHYYDNVTKKQIIENILSYGLKKVFDDDTFVIFGKSGTEGSNDFSIYCGALESKDESITKILTGN